MAAAALNYSGKVEEEDLNIICTGVSLSVKVSHPSKLYYWKGEITEETLKETQNIFSTINEFYESLIAVLKGESGIPAEVQIDHQQNLIICKFTVIKKIIEIPIKLGRVHHDA